MALKDLTRKTIEPRYRLINALDAGVAFLYGNMPLLVRTEIEELFRDGLLSFLACTSTLMEGVNLPCSNLFVRGPKRGRETLTDLFLFGLALDVVGAAILAKALLLKPDTVFRMSTNYAGTNAYLVVDRAQQRVAAEFGVGYLGVGFLLQVIGYSAELAGVNNATRATQLLGALVLAALAAGIASVTWTKRNRWRTDTFANKVLQLQHAEEKREWEARNVERQERGEPKEPMPSWLKDVPDSPWSQTAEE